MGMISQRQQKLAVGCFNVQVFSKETPHFDQGDVNQWPDLKTI